MSIDDKMIEMELPKLYHKGKQGAIYEWRVWTEGADIVTEYGQMDGQKVIARRTAEAKNVGRANATTVEEQAAAEAKSDWKFKSDRKYVDSLEKVHQRKIAVMKAPTDGWDNKKDPKKSTKKYAVYPGDVQPKLDGCRCLAYWEGDRIVLLSRGQQEWNLPHIVEELRKILPTDAMFDGELYVHGVPFQTIQSWITKSYPQTVTIGFHVYDIPVCDGEEKPWDERRKDLDRLIPGDYGKADEGTPHIVKVVTLEVGSEDEVMAFQVGCVELGFEGCMFRNRAGMYDWGHRSKNLLKVKTFEDAEFKCIGFTDGTGKNVGIVTWICSLDLDAAHVGYVAGYKPKDGDRTFNADPLGKYDERAAWFKDGNSFVGRLLTVKFQGFYESGTPRFPKGKAFRAAADLEK